ncbi:hypothetical protein IVB41_10445 [Bradyrhizobium sp. 44]|jgi:hypothetical protein|uniref:hypothetical protein n=1 Tax=unclassified Bradyrhizobium TaxID=2631580 RepID=UPI0012DC9C19|nr:MULTISPECIES: hypothetical protein [unclassified Bradyrhizobium]MCK1284340.1 hypothetical protein [Bradyrhizobium sp. 44]
MDIFRQRLRRISEESQRLNGVMVEVQRLRKLVDVAAAEAQNRQQERKVQKGTSASPFVSRRAGGLSGACLD